MIEITLRVEHDSLDDEGNEIFLMSLATEAMGQAIFPERDPDADDYDPEAPNGPLMAAGFLVTGLMVKIREKAE